MPTKPPPKREVRPGDLICGQCEEGNDPDRRFCRRCGASLIEAKEAVAPPPIPWWKRLFIRQPKVVAAGERPMRRGGSSGARDLKTRLRQAIRATAIVAAVLVALAYVGPWRSTVNGKVRSAASSVRQKIAPKLNEIPPATVDASTSLPDHKPVAAVDRLTNTYWAEGATGDGERQHLVVTFKPPIRVGKIGFSLGASTKDGDFVTEPRPKEVLLHFFNGDKELTSKKLTLKDVPDFQQHDLNVKDTDRVVIEIISVSRHPESGSNCSIAEVEFWERT